MGNAFSSQRQGNIHGNGNDGPLAAIMRIPPLTRSVVLGAITTTLSVESGLVDAAVLALDRKLIFKRSRPHVWRLLTTFLYFGSPSLSLALNLVMLYESFNSVEGGRVPLARERIGLGSLIMLASALATTPYVHFPFLSSSLVMMVNSLQSFDNPEGMVRLYGHFPVKLKFLPFAMIVLSVLMGGSPLPGLLGYMSAALAHYLMRPRGGYHAFRPLHPPPRARPPPLPSPPSTPWSSTTGYRLGGPV